MSLTALYPANPADVPLSLTQPSAEFKKEAVKVMLSILLFFVVYIVLVLLAIALAAGCAYGGVMLMAAAPSAITFVIGMPMIGLGALVLFFLIKFIFAVAKQDQSRNVEITEQEQPELFAFIRQITQDTQTPFPKKIFLNPDVNAAVFYNSNFWSMFFPVKKNLLIGLGLVNALNLSEFKAVIAHEFGHFSQRSMKLGSFVYNLNRVIYNMLFDNSGYSTVLNKFASAGGTFNFAARIAVKIVEGIQWILQKMYGLINKNYMGLSRQMEFHADSVSASISGSETCISALRRADVADACYNVVISKYNTWYKEQIIGQNFYANQQTVLRTFANDKDLKLDEHQLPVVDELYFNSGVKARVNFKDQWASHPAREDREAHLRGLNISAATRTEPAWTLFRNAEALQEQLTAKIYETVEKPENAVSFRAVEFDKKFQQEHHEYSFPELYNGFYDDREITAMDIRQLVAGDASKHQFSDIFSDANAEIAKKIQYLENDIRTVEAIHQKQLQVKTFDFDGEKYNRSSAGEVLEKLKGELETLKEHQKNIDEQAFRFFYALALQQGAGEKFQQEYEAFFNRRTADHKFYDDCNELLELIQPLYGDPNMTMQIAFNIVAKLHEDHEVRLKKHLRALQDEGIFKSNSEHNSLVTKFLNSNYHYVAETSFFQNEFEELRQVIFESSRILGEHRFAQLKQLLQFQLDLYSRN